MNTADPFHVQQQFGSFQEGHQPTRAKKQLRPGPTWLWVCSSENNVQTTWCGLLDLAYQTPAKPKQPAAADGTSAWASLQWPRLWPPGNKGTPDPEAHKKALDLLWRWLPPKAAIK